MSPFHNTDAMKKWSEITLTKEYLDDSDVELIKKYVAHKKIHDKVSVVRAYHLVFTLARCREFIQTPYAQLTIEALENGIIKMTETGRARDRTLKNGRVLPGKKFKDNTLHDYIKDLKTFVVYLIDNEILDIPVEKVAGRKGIKNISQDFETDEAADLLKPEHIIRLYNACTKSRDRAFIAMLYETAGRIGEVCFMKWQDVEPDAGGLMVRLLNSKTREKTKVKYRYVWLDAGASSYLDQWRQDYGPGAKGDNYIFISNKGEPLAYMSVFHLLDRVVKRSGIIDIHIHPHLFRKSRLTNWYNEGYPDHLIKEAGWGNQATGMSRIYAKFGKRDISKGFRKVKGIEDEKPVQPATAPVRCMKCKTENRPTAQFCDKCREPLTEAAMSERERGVKGIENSPSYPWAQQLVAALLSSDMSPEKMMMLAESLKNSK